MQVGEMILQVIVVAVFFNSLDAVSLYDDEESSTRRYPLPAHLEYPPVTVITNNLVNVTEAKNLNCEDFSKYALNCTIDAALMYNSSRKAPPMPAKITDWCRAIRHLTNRAVDWNTECRDVTDNHFSEESIQGHKHVINGICDDEWFLSRYDELPICIEATSDLWESCYSTFKVLIDEQKNKSKEWTHYELHFYMCCARASFRRCTLDSLFGLGACTHEQATTLQKFSVIVSEGDVYMFARANLSLKEISSSQPMNVRDTVKQDCDFNMMYTNCPGGDPRPTSHHLSELVSLSPKSNSIKPTSKLRNFFVILLLLLF